ncbi:hypothetical protein KC348_g17736 [Hortaea werneckii]|nr:hypothetical protein KC348_g17736 [Hortaea werneckii]
MGRSQSKSTRTLRLREDTAKYLLNLDLDSAKYDPKTRTMLDTADSTNELIAEDGFQKASGDAAEFEKATRYAWESQETGGPNKIHLQANPTEAQLTRKRKADDDLRKAEERKKFLADRYGVQDTAASDKGKKLAGAGVTSNENYVEYDTRGRIKGLPEKKEKSMYAEDVLINNHTSVWGSWWRDFAWGYACCHSTVKNSFCTGDAGKAAVEEAENFSKGVTSTSAPLPTAEEAGNAEAVPKDEQVEASGVESGAGGQILDEERTSHIPNQPDKPDKQKMDESRRRLEEMKNGVTEAEMEQYRKEKTNKADPMGGMLGTDELL